MGSDWLSGATSATRHRDRNEIVDKAPALGRVQQLRQVRQWSGDVHPLATCCTTRRAPPQPSKPIMPGPSMIGDGLGVRCNLTADDRGRVRWIGLLCGTITHADPDSRELEPCGSEIAAASRLASTSARSGSGRAGGCIVVLKDAWVALAPVLLRRRAT